MEEIHHYDAILESYKKQEAPLDEKYQELEKNISEYENAVAMLDKITKCYEDQQLKLTHKRLKFIEKMQIMMGVCEASDLSWKDVKQKQKKFWTCKDKMNILTENQINILQGASNGLKQLDIEQRLDNISSRIEYYRKKTKYASEIVGDHIQEYEDLNFMNKITDYQVSSEIREKYEQDIPPKSLSQTIEEIKKIGKSILTIDMKAKELLEQT